MTGGYLFTRLKKALFVLLAFFFCMIIGAVNAGEAILMGKYATQDGNYATINRLGAELTGTLHVANSQDQYNLVGVNTEQGNMTLKLVDINGAFLEESDFVLTKKRIENESGYEVFAVWQAVKKNNGNKYLNDLIGLLEADSSLVEFKGNTMNSISTQSLSTSFKKISDYFGKLGIDYLIDSQSVFDTLTENGDSVVVEMARPDAIGILARGFNSTSSLSKVSLNAGVKFQTLGNEKAIALVDNQGWFGVWDAAVSSTEDRATTRPEAAFTKSYNLSIPSSKVRNFKSIVVHAENSPIQTLIRSDFEVRQDFVRMLSNKVGSENFKCFDADNDPLRFVFGCAHHSDRYGFQNKQSWMITVVTVSLEVTMHGPRAALIPGSMVARKYKVTELEKLLPANYRKELSYPEFLEQQDYFMSEIENAFNRFEGN